ncbi:MAG: flagellar basal body L-ring protein FlgH [Pseudomonadota bacterium]
MKLLTLCSLIAILAGCSSTPPLAGPVPYPHYVDAPVTPAPVTGGIQVGTQELFADIRARQVGDILIIELEEYTDAEKSSSTSIARNSSNSITNPILAGRTRVIGNASNLEFQLDSDHEFQGGSDSNQSNRLKGTIAVTVARVLPGGNLLVSGEKWVSINRGREFIQLSGIVRPVDVSLENTVPSWRIANAEIHYGGEGETANANTAGWLSRFFMGAIWPF